MLPTTCHVYFGYVTGATPDARIAGLPQSEGIDKLSHLVRSYFKLDGHHIQFNVVDVDTLRKAQKNPDQYKDLIVRVAGYSDYFCDLNEALQNEIITRTEHKEF